MTKEDLKERFKELMNQNPPLWEIEKLFGKTLNSSALDYENDLEYDYRLVKIIYHAILCTMADQWQPFSKDNKEASANLQKFI
ncbi:hypothetical protein AS589_07845 [Empedobacter brevis]|uniref:hypothetical protein n=1 Tax=Empedobacter brevis TaxID=247 RepID=UPI00131FAEFF|nr:hypothetical protein [Empedobacter brevis]QHC84704.1 hypothetical protein AS589_07845 [Empedobacter brevis]